MIDKLMVAQMLDVRVLPEFGAEVGVLWPQLNAGAGKLDELWL